MPEVDVIEKEKEIVFYSASVNAWFNTKMEYDKSILVLSASAIGLLITLLTTIGFSTNIQLGLFITALICFIICIISILLIFTLNAKYIANLIHNKKENDPLLGILDYVSIFAFLLGILIAIIIGVLIANNSVLLKETEMTDKKETKEKIVIIKESFNDAHKIAPLNTDSKMTASFNGAQKIAPLAPVQVIITTNTDKVIIPQPAGQTQTTGSEGKDKE